jgi:hypothetical protein
MSRPIGLPKTGGRMKGAPNRTTWDLESTLSEAGIDVPRSIAELLPTLPPERAVSVLLELMQYLYPKRKAIDPLADILKVEPFIDDMDFSKDLKILGQKSRVEKLEEAREVLTVMRQECSGDDGDDFEQFT